MLFVDQVEQHAGHDMPAMATPAAPADETQPPPIPTDHAAERVYSPAAMAAARAQLMKEHGGVKAWTVRLDQLEYRARDGADGQSVEGEAWWGGDASHWVVKARGERADHTEKGDGGWERGEAQVLKAWPAGPYFDLQAGVRYDLVRQGGGRGRSYATVGFEGVAPYWIKLDGAVFLSDRGKVSARGESAYDLRLTQKLVLQPRVEADLAEAGAGRLEGGLRLRYEITREFAPYVGVVRERTFGALTPIGERAGSTAFVVGVRAWR
jgi:copper resistance protein B